MNLEIIEFESEILKDNPLKDPSKRKVALIYPDKPEERPIILYLSGFLSSSLAQLNYQPLGEDMKTKVERLTSEGKLNGPIVVLPDMFTKVGGNQYINSSAVGMYEDFLVKELIPYLKDKFKSEMIGVIGHSSGGYGALYLGMKYPNLVKSIASHSGDAYFEYVYLPIFPKAIEQLRKFKSPKEWLNNYWRKENKHHKEDLITLNVIGMSAFYSPKGEDFELPFDLETGEILEDIWRKWLEKDPVRMIDKYHDNLKKLKLIFVDVGRKDEFNIQYGTRILHKKMEKYGIAHYYEEFNDGHTGISYRYDISLSLIEKSLSYR
ncbi:alpha/beta hydrolase [Saccharolobus caldissimus]|uniref:S-formylglutathione hydrolase n=1 Tax=Saccharolobus caldissimus TaxID=1702097 RepID=A0AAQ4CW67_9CREN|nr:alpha/beta fold hydrolase [Saccharolobus caldissimus]BDC00049.1 esterase [Saccharolobus caldissimus]